MWTSVKSLFSKWQLRISLLALFWILLTTLAEAIPLRTSGIRSIYFRPYRYSTGSWDSFVKGSDYEYEDDEFVSVEPEPRPRPKEPYPEPEPVSFGGRFHVSQDRFVSFGASDVMVGRPPLKNTFQPNNYPPPIRTVPSESSPKYEPTNTGDLPDIFRPGIPPSVYLQETPDSKEYFTPPSVRYRPTELLPPPPTSAYGPPEPSEEEEFTNFSQNEEKHNGHLEEKNLTDANLLLEHVVNNERGPKVEEDNISHQGNVPPIEGNRWQKPLVLSTLNKLTATTTSSPHDLSFTTITTIITTSHNLYGDLEPEAATSSGPIIVDWNDHKFPPHELSAIEVPNGSRHESSISSVSQPNSNTSGIAIDTNGTDNSTSGPSESTPRGWRLSTGAIAGIVIGILTPLSLVAGAVVYLMYGRHFKNIGNKSDSRSTTDNCAYIDDSIRPSGYMNSHIELPKENSEEMTSLDNDSFLNSLEAVTIQNYWAESAKNTKV